MFVVSVRASKGKSALRKPGVELGVGGGHETPYSTYNEGFQNALLLRSSHCNSQNTYPVMSGRRRVVVSPDVDRSAKLAFFKRIFYRRA